MHRDILLATPIHAHQETAARVLRYFGSCTPVEDGWRCLRLVTSGRFHAVVLWPGLSRLSPIEVVRAIRRTEGYETFPVVYVGRDHEGLGQAFKGDDDLHIAPDPGKNADQFILTIMRAVSRSVMTAWQGRPEPQRVFLCGCLNLMQSISQDIGRFDAENHQELTHICEALVDCLKDGMTSELLEALDAHDDYTLIHSMRVAVHLAGFALALKVPSQDAVMLAEAGVLHDIGKVVLPTGLLTKPTTLNDQEWQVMRTHPDRGVDLLENVALPDKVFDVVRSHHERLDGSGYPRGLMGSAIDDVVLLAAVADVYAALTDRRSYRPAMTPAKAAEVMAGMAGHHLDSHFVSRFIQFMVS